MVNERVEQMKRQQFISLDSQFIKWKINHYTRKFHHFPLKCQKTPYLFVPKHMAHHVQKIANFEGGLNKIYFLTWIMKPFCFTLIAQFWCYLLYYIAEYTICFRTSNFARYSILNSDTQILLDSNEKQIIISENFFFFWKSQKTAD